jgi:hypothetical protein
MRAEISFDHDMSDDMEFVEGTYRLPGLDWQVFIFGPGFSVDTPVVNTKGRWESGITGTHVRWPDSGWTLNKDVVLRILSEHLGVTEWDEVRGPDSIKLR